MDGCAELRSDFPFLPNTKPRMPKSRGRAVTEDLAAQMTDARTVGCTEFGEIITKLL